MTKAQQGADAQARFRKKHYKDIGDLCQLNIPYTPVKVKKRFDRLKRFKSRPGFLKDLLDFWERPYKNRSRREPKFVTDLIDYWKQITPD